MKYFYRTFMIALIVTNVNYSNTAVGQNKSMYENTPSWFPEDFNPQEIVLLIPKANRKNQIRKMEKLLESYPYEYYIYDDRYYLPDSIKNNPKKYRFHFNKRKWSETIRDNFYKNGYTNYYVDYSFYDNLEKINYPFTGYHITEHYSYDIILRIIEYIIWRYNPTVNKIEKSNNKTDSVNTIKNH